MSHYFDLNHVTLFTFVMM